MHIHRLATVDSTNLEAGRLIAAGERGPLWIIAAEQTSGKGRLGRHWVSKPGNLYSTLLWPTQAPASALSQISFVTAIAVHQAASAFAAPSAITLKWPNDCLLNGDKFCGILAEVLAPGLAAIGIGVNIGHVPEDLPYKAARLEHADVESVFEKLAASLSHWLEIWNDGTGFSTIKTAWEARCSHIGSRVSVDGAAGIFEGLGPNGAMLLRSAKGESRLIYAGDVRVEYQTRP